MKNEKRECNDLNLGNCSLTAPRKYFLRTEVNNYVGKIEISRFVSIGACMWVSVRQCSGWYMGLKSSPLVPISRVNIIGSDGSDRC